MLVRSALISLLFPLCVVAKAPDLKSIDKMMEKIIPQIKAEKSFHNKFKYISIAKKMLEKEVSSIKDSEYDKNIDIIFQFNFMITTLADLETPFQKNDCSFQKKRFIKNFSDYKTYKIHDQLVDLSGQSLKFFNAICGN